MDSDFHARPWLDRLLVPLGGDSVQTSVKFLSPVCAEKDGRTPSEGSATNRDKTRSVGDWHLWDHGVSE